MKCVVCGEEVKGTYEIVPGVYNRPCAECCFDWICGDTQDGCNQEGKLAQIHPMCTKE